MFKTAVVVKKSDPTG